MECFCSIFLKNEAHLWGFHNCYFIHLYKFIFLCRLILVGWLKHRLLVCTKGCHKFFVWERWAIDAKIWHLQFYILAMIFWSIATGLPYQAIGGSFDAFVNLGRPSVYRTGTKNNSLHQFLYLVFLHFLLINY